MLRQRGNGVDVGVSRETRDALDRLKPYLAQALIQGTHLRAQLTAARDELIGLGTVQPIFDPTGFMRTSSATEEWIEFLRTVIVAIDQAAALNQVLIESGLVGAGTDEACLGR